MRRGRAAYLVGALGAGAAHAASAGAGFASLFLLNRLIGKEGLGGYSFAMAAVLVAGSLATLGLDRAMLLRVANRRPRERLRGRRLAAFTALASFVAGAAFAAGLCAAALWSDRLDPVAGEWLLRLAAATPWVAAAAILASWYQANHRVAMANVAPALSDVARCLFLALVLAVGGGAAGVAWSVVAAAAVPVATLAALAAGRSTPAPGRLGAADFRLGAQFLSLRIATVGSRQVDLLALGLLSDAATTAEYAVASRVATLADFGRLALQPTFMPRIRRRLATSERSAGLAEYEAARLAGLAAALACGVAFLAAGPAVLGLLGDFDKALAPLALLCAAYVVQAGAGMHQALLAMTGEVRLSAAIRYAGLAALAAALWLLVPRYGAVGAGVAVLAVAVLTNAAGALLAQRLCRLPPIDMLTVVAVGAAVAALCVAAFGAADPLVAAAAVAASLAALGPRAVALLARRRGDDSGRP